MSNKSTPPANAAPKANEAPKADDLALQLTEANTLIASLQGRLQTYESQFSEMDAEITRLQGSLQASEAQVQKHASAGQGTHLSIASAHPAGKHMRAGREWSRTPNVVPKDDFSPEQIKQLKADGNLVVVEI